MSGVLCCQSSANTSQSHSSANDHGCGVLICVCPCAGCRSCCWCLLVAVAIVALVCPSSMEVLLSSPLAPFLSLGPLPPSCPLDTTSTPLGIDAQDRTLRPGLTTLCHCLHTFCSSAPISSALPSLGRVLLAGESIPEFLELASSNGLGGCSAGTCGPLDSTTVNLEPRVESRT